MALQRLHRDLKEMLESPPALCSAEPINDDLFSWKALIVGPEGSPYKNGLFELRLSFSNDYPFKPPKVKFITKIYHPNVDSFNGEVCLDILNDKWTPTYGVAQVLLSIIALMSDPNPDSARNRECANLYKSNYAMFEETAKNWTADYARGE